MRALILVFGSILHFSYGLTVGIESHQDYTYLKYSNSMYKYHHNEELSWDDAKAACVNEGASLFVPEDKAEITAVQELFKVEHTVWVGITRTADNNTFRAIDGRPLSNETDWFKTYYGFLSSTEYNCIYMYSGKFSNLICSAKYPFICKYRIGVIALAQPYNYVTSSTEAVQTASPQTVTPQTVTTPTVTPQTVTLQSVLCDHHFGEGNRTADHTSRSPNLFEQVISEELNKFPPSETLAVKAAVINTIAEQWQRVHGTVHETVDLTCKQPEQNTTTTK